MRVSMRSVIASAVLCWTVAGSSAGAQTAEVTDESPKALSAALRKAERERIQNERTAINAKRQHEEAACYQRFSVEDCLRGVRAKVRDAETRLRTQEIELNDAERKEKAAERLRSIEEKAKGVPPAPAQGGIPGASVRGAPVVANPQAQKATLAQRERDAERRAQDQRDRVQTQASEQATRNGQNADRAAKARARQAQVIKEAEERRARVKKSQADAAAAGRKPAAPLPAASLPAGR
jgi:colicin import membrane protein